MGKHIAVFVDGPLSSRTTTLLDALGRHGIAPVDVPVGARGRSDLAFIDGEVLERVPDALEHFEGPVLAIVDDLGGVSALDHPALAGVLVASELERTLPTLVTAAVAADPSTVTHLKQELRAAQRLRLVANLAAGAAHDFNNLLTAILTYTDFLLEDLADDPDTHADVKEIEGAARRAAVLTKQLLVFTRRRFAKPELINLAEVVEQLEKLFRRALGETFELELRLGPTELVDQDVVLVDQALFWLVMHARAAMSHGGRVSIAVGEHEDDTGQRYAGVDITYGDGSDAESLETLLEASIDEESAEMEGLVLTRRIARDCGGFVRAHAEDGHSTVAVYFPTSVAPPPRVGAETPDSATVVVVEDEALVRNLVRRILAANGFDVRTAADGEEGLALIRDLSPQIDLVLTDVVMPHRSGVELANVLQTIAPDVPVLFMSGYADDVLDEHGVGNDIRLLQKPFTADELLRAVTTSITH